VPISGPTPRSNPKSRFVAGTVAPKELESALCIVMVETEFGLANVDQIASTPGLDGIYIGPSDLAIGLGLTPTFGEIKPPTREAIATIREACHRHKVVAGIQANTGSSARAELEEVRSSGSSDGPDATY